MGAEQSTGRCFSEGVHACACCAPCEETIEQRGPFQEKFIPTANKKFSSNPASLGLKEANDALHSFTVGRIWTESDLQENIHEARHGILEKCEDILKPTPRHVDTLDTAEIRAMKESPVQAKYDTPVRIAVRPGRRSPSPVARSKNSDGMESRSARHTRHSRSPERAHSPEGDRHFSPRRASRGETRLEGIHVNRRELKPRLLL